LISKLTPQFGALLCNVGDQSPHLLVISKRREVRVIAKKRFVGEPVLRCVAKMLHRIAGLAQEGVDSRRLVPT
jgi:hypothetical protein